MEIDQLILFRFNNPSVIKHFRLWFLTRAPRPLVSCAERSAPKYKMKNISLYGAQRPVENNIRLDKLVNISSTKLRSYLHVSEAGSERWATTATRCD